MTDAAFALADIDRLAGGRIGTYDVPCPWCGPSRRSPINQRRRVLRVWRIDPGFASYHCARCGEHGYATEKRRGHRPVDRDEFARAKGEAEERERVSRAEGLEKARWLWSQRQPIAGTPAEQYLREGRGYYGPRPPTLAYLPARGDYPHALIAAFGLPTEPEPGELAIADAAMLGVHITRLAPDGADRERGDGAKIMVGRSVGLPIVLAPLNDLLGLAITEGIEDGLSVFGGTGLGVWVAGCASRMPALADAIPGLTDCVTIHAHGDDAGQDGARKLAATIKRRGIEAVIEGL
jgi:hypothetical protein